MCGSRARVSCDVKCPRAGWSRLSATSGSKARTNRITRRGGSDALLLCEAADCRETERPARVCERVLRVAGGESGDHEEARATVNDSEFLAMVNNAAEIPGESCPTLNDYTVALGQLRTQKAMMESMRQMGNSPMGEWASIARGMQNSQLEQNSLVAMLGMGTLGRSKY